MSVFFCLLGNFTWVIFRPVFCSYEKQGMIFRIVSHKETLLWRFDLLLWQYACVFICMGVNLAAILNWNMKDARVEVIHDTFMEWSFYYLTGIIWLGLVSMPPLSRVNLKCPLRHMLGSWHLEDSFPSQCCELKGYFRKKKTWKRALMKFFSCGLKFRMCSYSHVCSFNSASQFYLLLTNQKKCQFEVTCTLIAVSVHEWPFCAIIESYNQAWM